MIVGLTSIIGAFSLGDVAKNLVTWFDEYSNDTKTETDGDSNGEQDPDGTAAMFDVTFHYLTFFMGYSLFTVIAVGGNIFGLTFMKFNEDLECDFTSVDDATKQDLIDLFNTIDSV
jgi:hypothetical protein